MSIADKPKPIRVEVSEQIEALPEVAEPIAFRDRDALWQAVPFLVEQFRRIGADRVLEVTEGPARWGPLARAFSGEDVEVVSRLVTPAALDDELAQFASGWSVIVLDGVLGQLDVESGLALVRRLLQHGVYVVADVPLGEPLPARKRRAKPSELGGRTWCEADIAPLPSPARMRVPNVRTGRPIGVYVFSTRDPAGLGKLRQDFGADDVVWGDALGIGADLEASLWRVEEMAFELAYIKGYSTYRWANRLRLTPAWNLLRWTRTRNRQVLTLKVGAGRVRVRRASAQAGHPGVPWDFVEPSAGFTREHDVQAAYETALVGSGRLRVPTGDDPAIELVGPGTVEVHFAGKKTALELPEEPIVFRPAHPQLPVPARKPIAPSPGVPAQAPAITDGQRAFVERIQASSDKVVAVHCPRWLGITSSTRTLFDQLYPVPEAHGEEPFHYTEDDVEHHARVLIESGAEHVVFSGGDTMHFRVMEVLKREKPSVRCDMLWHASFVQFLEDYNWHNIRSWIDAARAGLVHTVGVVKAGMEEFLSAQGVRSKLVLNLVPGDVQEVPELEDGPHVGMWLSNPTYRKIPHAMLSAVAMVPGAQIHAAGLDDRSLEVIDYFNIPKGFTHKGPIPHDELLMQMRRTHLSLYVTFSECCPMVPLESLALGVPCLTGPNSHLFEDDAYLFERLVVPFPDRADVIAKMIARGVEERVEIVARYRDYAVGYNERARQSVGDFLGEG